MKRIQLSDHFKVSTILLFSLPSIGMQIVDSTYQVVDGYFISNYIGESAFGAENLIYPPLLILMSLGLMFGSGASALLSKEMGEGHGERANQMMTMLTWVLTGAGIVLSTAMFFLMPQVARWVGASDDLLGNCIAYGRVLAIFMPFQMLSMAFHALLIAAERPALGLAVTISNALLNILLDWAFVVVYNRTYVLHNGSSNSTQFVRSRCAFWCGILSWTAVHPNLPLNEISHFATTDMALSENVHIVK
mgnify:CR=1 FL=1